MAIYQKTWRHYLPDFDLYIHAPFFSLETRLFCERTDMMMIEWVALYWQVWKWQGRFKLYTPIRR